MSSSDIIRTARAPAVGVEYSSVVRQTVEHLWPECVRMPGGEDGAAHKPTGAQGADGRGEAFEHDQVSTVVRPRSPDRFSSLVRCAPGTEPPTTITAHAEPKLNATPPTDDKPETLGRHWAPSRRFRDKEHGLG